MRNLVCVGEMTFSHFYNQQYDIYRRVPLTVQRMALLLQGFCSVALIDPRLFPSEYDFRGQEGIFEICSKQIPTLFEVGVNSQRFIPHRGHVYHFSKPVSSAADTSTRQNQSRRSSLARLERLASKLVRALAPLSYQQGSFNPVIILRRIS